MCYTIDGSYVLYNRGLIYMCTIKGSYVLHNRGLICAVQ